MRAQFACTKFPELLGSSANTSSGYILLVQQKHGATFSKLLRKISGKNSYLIDDLGKTAILKTS